MGAVTEGVDYHILSKESQPRLEEMLNSRRGGLDVVLAEAEVRDCDYVFFQMDGEWKKMMVHRSVPMKYAMEKVLS
jgi:hypothetical protein